MTEPKDIARMITEDPDVLSEGACPLCGSEGRDSFTAFYCSNPSCQNYDEQTFPHRSLKADRYIVYSDPDEGEWLVGFEYDMDGPDTIWALNKEGKFLEGQEFDDLLGHDEHRHQVGYEDVEFYRIHGFDPSSAQGQPIILNDKARRMSGWWDRFLAAKV